MQHDQRLVDAAVAEATGQNQLAPPIVDVVWRDRVQRHRAEGRQQMDRDGAAVIAHCRWPALAVMLDVVQPGGDGLGEGHRLARTIRLATEVGQPVAQLVLSLLRRPVGNRPESTLELATGPVTSLEVVDRT